MVLLLALVNGCHGVCKPTNITAGTPPCVHHNYRSIDYNSRSMIIMLYNTWNKIKQLIVTMIINPYIWDSHEPQFEVSLQTPLTIDTKTLRKTTPYNPRL